MIAIINGDLINSTGVKSEYLEWLVDNFQTSLKLWDGDYRMKSEVTRGDSFQCLVNNTANALRAALIQKTYLKSITYSDINANSRRKKKSKHNEISFDARIAIGIGDLDFLNENLATSNGKAFELSGKLLDKMKSRKQTIGITTLDNYNDEFQVSFTLLDALLSKLTSSQCEVINLKLLGYTEKEIADIIKINQAAVNQRSTAGNWNAIDTLIQRFEKIYGHE